ncbi:MAG: response regulator [Rudaea sp.]
MTRTAEQTETADRRRALLPPVPLLAFLAAFAAVLLIAFASFKSLAVNVQNAERLTGTISTLRETAMVLSAVKDAETGQRGFLLTSSESYLDPYIAGKGLVDGRIDSLEQLLAGNPDELQRLKKLRQAVHEKLDELDLTISLKRENNMDAALAMVRTDRGKLTMDRIRAIVGEITQSETDILAGRQIEWRKAADNSFRVVWMGSLALLFLIIVAAVMMSRDYRERETEAWIRGGLMRLNDRLRGGKRLDTLGEQILGFLAGRLRAQAGAIYVNEGGDRYERFATHALAETDSQRVLAPGSGLLGQAVKDDRVVHLVDVPEAYMTIGSSVGKGKPREIVIAPASVDGGVQAVIELGFFRRTLPSDIEFMKRASESLAIALRSARDRSRLETLLEETQHQAEELQAQQEELRVNNEELEEQGRVLKESQAQLEIQQAELEQTNSHLEEQTQELEAQRDDLADTQAILAKRADELQRVNQYKSEFLANMSHELRTPLNSTLILAKLLADNKSGNLSAEQVKFAETISSAGNDLLALINDILDLSKIEAGKIDISIEQVTVGKVMESIARTFRPLAEDKGLEFSIVVESGAPSSIETDGQRLGQILRNLISNALKFTSHGSISVGVRADARYPGMLCFSVRDSGIGIAFEQQGFIFDAFRQADGSTHRKYGGTGLGLSISRDLARRLGGEVDLDSAIGAGSKFTLRLPLRYVEPASASEVIAPHEAAARAPAPMRISEPARMRTSAERAIEESTPAVAAGAIEDDRERLREGHRLILVIEDDIRFAGILRDLIRESGFACIATHTANDGLAAATLYRPSAILLDMNLPDHSGLGVLDQLKRNPLTRHIPVHVLSVADYSHEARELGAVGYALKPVKREEIKDALTRLEARLAQTLRRVLVIEDDARQGESIRQLLGSADVEIRVVGRGGDALQQLAATTFDCVVMDLNLPDMSGYALLQKMADQENVSFPPVVVYTGRNLSRDEEQALHRFSKSIIIKDARSPERLLDEVTLFLHQVESKLPATSQRLLREVRNRDAALEGRRILVVEDDVRNIFALSSVLELKGAKIEIARNGREALAALDASHLGRSPAIDLVLMDIMMPEMDGIEAMQQIRKRAEWRRLPIIALTAKAMRDDQEKCLAAGANDYIAKPLDVERLLSLIRVWMPKS